jgi:hypothetical protein
LFHDFMHALLQFRRELTVVLQPESVDSPGCFRELCSRFISGTA